MPIDTFNKFFIGVHGSTLVFLRQAPQTLTPDDALLLAAYLVVTADHPMMKPTHSFAEVLEAVRNT